jgi:hypothetical protein
MLCTKTYAMNPEMPPECEKNSYARNHPITMERPFEGDRNTSQEVTQKDSAPPTRGKGLLFVAKWNRQLRQGHKKII